MLDEGDSHRPLPAPASIVCGGIEAAGGVVPVGPRHATRRCRRSHDVEHGVRVERVPIRVDVCPG